MSICHWQWAAGVIIYQWMSGALVKNVTTMSWFEWNLKNLSKLIKGCQISMVKLPYATAPPTDAAPCCVAIELLLLKDHTIRTVGFE